MIQLLKYGNTNCYYIKGKNGGLLVDTDWAGTLQAFYRKMKELDIHNFTPTTVALQGVANLIEKGLTLQEIKILTGFETQKIEDISK